MPPASARKPSRRISLLAFGGIMLGLATAWGVSRVRERPRVELVPISKPAGKVAQQSAAIDLSEVPVTGEKQAATGDKLSTCVAGYLPRGAFAKPPDLSALCSEQDPRAGTAKLHAAIASGARAGAEPTAAMKIWSRLGWHELLAFSVIRSGCCPDAKPLSLPNPSSGCPAMDAPLREVGKAVVNNQNYETPLKAFSDAITCEAGHGRAALYGRTGKPDPAEEAAFLELVKAVQAP
jgi:hypothetical protein